MATQTATDLFTAADRCDRCSARASVLALLHGGGQLQFCGHHARAHGEVLTRIAECFGESLAFPPVPVAA